MSLLSMNPEKLGANCFLMRNSCLVALYVPPLVEAAPGKLLRWAASLAAGGSKSRPLPSSSPEESESDRLKPVLKMKN